MKIIALMKNKEILRKKKFRKFINKFADIKYLLFNIDDSINTFIIHEPKEYMRYFAKASITFQCAIRQYSSDNPGTENHPTLMTCIKKEINDITELMKYLHSLNRIRYWNKLSASDDALFYEIIDFALFNVEITDVKNNVIFNKEMNIKNQKGLFGVNEILKSIDKIYNPCDFKNHTFIEMDNTWNFIDYIESKDNIYGIYLPKTKSISFLHGKDIQILKENLKSVYCYTITYNNDNKLIKENAEDTFDYYFEIENAIPESKYCKNCYFRFQNIWEHTIDGYVEFIKYLPYIYYNLLLISTINDFGSINKSTYACLSKFEFEYYDKDMPKYTRIATTNESPLLLDDLISKINEATNYE